MSELFNEDLDHVSKNLVFCSINLNANSLTNKTQFNCDLGFSEKIETKRRCCADYIGSDSNAATHKFE